MKTRITDKIFLSPAHLGPRRERATRMDARRGSVTGRERQRWGRGTMTIAAVAAPRPGFAMRCFRDALLRLASRPLSLRCLLQLSAQQRRLAAHAAQRAVSTISLPLPSFCYYWLISCRLQQVTDSNISDLRSFIPRESTPHRAELSCPRSSPRGLCNPPEIQADSNFHPRMPFQCFQL